MEAVTFSNWLLLFETGSYTVAQAGWHYVTQAGRKPLETLTSATEVLGLEACTVSGKVPSFAFSFSFLRKKCAWG